MSRLGEAQVEETIHAKALWREELGTEGLEGGTANEFQ